MDKKETWPDAEVCMCVWVCRCVGVYVCVCVGVLVCTWVCGYVRRTWVCRCYLLIVGLHCLDRTLPMIIAFLCFIR